MRTPLVLISRAVPLVFAVGACTVRVQSMPPPPPFEPRVVTPIVQQPVEAAPADTATTEIDVVPDRYADTDPSALTTFRSTLDRHGAWTEDATYGTVWVPSATEVGPDFVPYVSAGHWVYDSDYVWVSDYPWGWATFHYGRWARSQTYGWAWIPGRVYSDAWVVWRSGDDALDYVGWAPQPPAWVWRGGVAVGVDWVPPPPYVYCRRHEVFAPRVSAWLARGDVGWIERRSRPFDEGWEPGRHAWFEPRPQHGPSPGMLHIDPARIARPHAVEPGLLAARQYARPASARALGAPPPTRHVVRSPPRSVTAPQGR